MSDRLHIFALTAVLFLTGLLSCEKEAHRPVVGKEARCVHVSVNCPSLPGVKSGAGEGDLEEGRLNSLRVYAFIDGELVGYHHQESSVKTSFLMDFFIEEPHENNGHHIVDFYIIANEASMVMEADMPVIDENLTEEQLKNLRFIAIAPDSGLPMSLVKTVDVNVADLRDMSTIDPELASGHESFNLIEQSLRFELVRAVGKLTVSVVKSSASTPDVFIKSLVMLARGTRHYNYLMPQTVDFLKNLQPRVNDRAVLDENTTCTVTSHTDFEEVASIYCSENPFGSAGWNIPNSDNSIVLRAEYSIGEGQEVRTAYIYLPPVDRNHWVQVNCTVVGEGAVSVSYTVNDWTLGENADDDYMIFDYPTHTYLLPALPTESDPLPNPDPEDGPAVEPVMSTTSPFIGYFQMLYPEGQEWIPTLFRIDRNGTSASASASDYDVKVYLVENGSETLMSEPYGLNGDHDSYYKIVITPLESGNDGAKVYLGITTVIQGFGHAEYLLINGSQAEIFWPESGGTDPNALIIEQKE